MTFASDATAEATEPPSTATVPAEATSPPATAEASEPIDPATLLETASISDLLDGMASGAFTAVDLMEATLARIEKFDRQGPELGAVIEVISDAVERAQAADDKRASGEPLGPLHGIPVLVKDIIATKDDTSTAAGSFAMVDNVVVRDAFLVEQLRTAGAIVLGKANLTEWSNFKGDGGAAGYSPRGGQSRNPYDPDLSPSGSSSGSAISVAAGYVPVAIGSETNGSIISPAAYCGVVGLKPTTGLVSRSGVIPISLSQDSPGPITRSVTDAAIMLSVLAGYDPDDVLNGELAPYAPAAQFETSPIPEPGTADYRSALDAGALDGARIGIYRRLFGFDPVIDEMVEDVMALMVEAGADLVDEIDAGTLTELEEFEERYSIYLTEFSAGLKAYCEAYTPDGPVMSMADVVEYNNEHPDEELVYSDQYALEDVANTTSALDDPVYLELLEAHTELARAQGIDAIMDDADVDVLIAPSAGLPPEINQAGEEYTGSSSGFAAFAGYPSITIPIGDIDGLPVGLHFFGRAFSEKTLLAIAYATERLVPERTPPRL